MHSCQLSMSSCSKVPDGPNPRRPLIRKASLTSGGAALSTNIQAQISISPGPLGCQTRKEWEVDRIIDRLGKTVDTMGLTCSALAPRRLTVSGPGLLFVGDEFRFRCFGDVATAQGL